MDDFELELKQGFLEEAGQSISDTEQCFLELESDPSNAAILDKIFRLAHNLKGSAKAVGFDEVGAFAHEFESYLLKIKNGQLSPSPETVNLLLRCNDHLGHMIESLKLDINASFDSSDLMAELKEERPGSLASESSLASGEAITQGESFENQEASEESQTPSVPESHSEISAEDIELLRQFDEQMKSFESPAPVGGAAPVQEKISEPPAPRVSSKKESVKAVPPSSESGAKDESIRVSLSRLEKLLNYVGELVILQTVLREQSMTAHLLALRKTAHQMGKVTKEVQDIAMSLRMVPLKQTFQKMQRIVRDTAQALGKKVNLILEGEETEVDKTVLESLGDPLVHMIRNAVDHGIEEAGLRAQRQKAEVGTIVLKAYHQGGKLVIEVRDDGGGIDPGKLRAKALEKGILKPGQAISDKDAQMLIFHAGFSTKSVVTDVSGRGVGMDVVKTNIEALQGEIQLESVVGQGSTFKIFLPLTLAIIEAMVVDSAGQRFVIPMSHVHESVRPTAKDVHKATTLGEILMLRGENLPLFRLSTLLKRPDTAKEAHEGIALVIRTTSQPFAVLVDDILGQYQVVVKKLGVELQNQKGFSGSAILGDGKPALILELSELIHQGKGAPSSGARSSEAQRRLVA